MPILSDLVDNVSSNAELWTSLYSRINLKLNTLQVYTVPCHTIPWMLLMARKCTSVFEWIQIHLPCLGVCDSESNFSGYKIYDGWGAPRCSKCVCSNFGLRQTFNVHSHHFCRMSIFYTDYCLSSVCYDVSHHSWWCQKIRTQFTHIHNKTGNIY